jgi:hypothetical protein
MPSRRTALVLGIADALTAALVVFGVFVGLPTRWWPVDSAAAILAVIELASGVGLVTGARWAAGLALLAGAIALTLGLFAVTTLAVTASWLGGVYGAVGHGGAIVLALVAALVFPYLVVLPMMQILCLRAQAVRGGRAAEPS